MRKSSFIPVSQPYQEGWISSKSPSVRKFEEKFAEFVGSDYAVSCSSGTTALTLALGLFGVRAGDEVIVPEFTMISTAWSVSYHGATPIFVDCAFDLNVDVSLIEEKITPRTKAIIPVHVYGRPANMEAIMKLAYEYNLIVIEDAAEAFGASIDGKKVGTIGDVGCFSLFANKIISTGEGGMITTNNKRHYEQLQHLKNMAFDEDHSFLHKKLAYNYRMSGVQADVGLRQLEKIDEILEKREWVLREYDERLKKFTTERPEGSVLWMYDIKHEDRDGLAKYLKHKGIETRLFFKPMSMQPMYKGEYKDLQAYWASLHGLYLPSFPELSAEQISYISNKVLKY